MTLYTASGTNQGLSLNITNTDGTFSQQIGLETIFDPVGGLAYDCINQIMYGITFDFNNLNLINIYTININNGSWTNIGSIDTLLQSRPVDMTYYEGKLYVNLFDMGTYVIDIDTITGSLLGSTGLIDHIYFGITYDCENKIMYGIVRDGIFSTDDYYLSIINIETGEWTKYGNPLGVNITQITYDQDNEILYGKRANLSSLFLYNINTSNGMPNLLGSESIQTNSSGIVSVNTNCCVEPPIPISVSKRCKKEIPKPPLSNCVRSYLSPIGECSRFKNSTGAGLGARTSPIHPCIDKKYTQDEKDQLVRDGYWNYYSKLKPNSPLSNRLVKLQNKFAQRK